MSSFKGVVVSTKCAQTAKVKVERSFLHPLYGKRVKKSSTFLVHDLIGVKKDDVVKIKQCRPISKMKRHIIEEVL